VLQFISDGVWYIGVIGYTSVNFAITATWTRVAGSLGCDGVPASGLVYDMCGVCGGDSKSCGSDIPLANGATQLQTVTLDAHSSWSFFTADLGPSTAALNIEVTATSVLSDPDLYTSSAY
jgi:hypothetical protein